MSTTGRPSTRLVDLGLAWTEQYAPEIDLYHGSVADEVRPSLARLDGYLSATDLAFVLLTADPRRMGPNTGPVDAFVGAQMARVQAEFSGRLILDQESLRLLAREPRDHLTWAVLGLSGAGDLLTGAEDHQRSFRRWIDHGLRVIGIDRPCPNEAVGETAWVTEALNRLAGCRGSAPSLAVDLGGLYAQEREQALAWFERPPGRDAGLSLIATRVQGRSDDQSAGPGQIGPEQAARIIALGGLVGLSVVPGPEALATTVEVLREAGFGPGAPGALGLATDFPRPSPDGLAMTVDGLRTWARDRFGPSDAAWLLGGSARAWLGRWFSVAASPTLS